MNLSMRRSTNSSFSAHHGTKLFSGMIWLSENAVAPMLVKICNTTSATWWLSPLCHKKGSR